MNRPYLVQGQGCHILSSIIDNIDIVIFVPRISHVLEDLTLVLSYMIGVGDRFCRFFWYAP
jgi:hypothetical protein